MGEFCCLVVHGLDGIRTQAVEALVNTGATYTWVPKTILEGRGYCACLRRKLRLTDGSVVEREGTGALLKADDAVLDAVAILSDRKLELVLGAATLEELCLGLDQVARWLVPIEALLMRPHALGRR